MLTIVTNSSKGSATFDITRCYRYCLTRSWPDTRQTHHQVTFIMLNPSRANADQDDPTIRACLQFAQHLGYTQLTVVNLFAYRTPHPSDLQQASDPIGPDNDRHLIAATQSAEKVILAWGNWGTLMNRAKAVVTLLSPYRHKLYCLGRNCTEQPRHPLYIKRTTKPQLWC